MEDGMRLRGAAFVIPMVLWSAASFGQGAEAFKPTETVAPDIPGRIGAP
jgi:hypothetical protein